MLIVECLLYRRYPMLDAVLRLPIRPGAYQAIDEPWTYNISSISNLLSFNCTLPTWSFQTYLKLTISPSPLLSLHKVHVQETLFRKGGEQQALVGDKVDSIDESEISLRMARVILASRIRYLEPQSFPKGKEMGKRVIKAVRKALIIYQYNQGQNLMIHNLPAQPINPGPKA